MVDEEVSEEGDEEGEEQGEGDSEEGEEEGEEEAEEEGEVVLLHLEDEDHVKNRHKLWEVEDPVDPYSLSN